MMRLSPVTWLVAVAVILIAAFVGSTLLGERNSRRVDERVSDIIDDAAPSVAALAAARTEMRRLEIGAGRLVDAEVADLSTERALLDLARAALDRRLQRL